MNDSERKLAQSLIQTRILSPEEVETCLMGRIDGEPFVDALVRQGTIQTGELERVLGSLPDLEEETDNTFARAVKKIGRYRVISEIGRGGMGRVYLAYDPNLKRSVALKVMRIEELEDAARYRRETEIAAGLQHPNIGAIYDAQQEEETFVIAMQFIDGDSLDKARLDPREALKAIGEAARAVHFAHDHGIIHRDIKPENIMRTRDGRVFIMDFGVARRIERKASLTQTGTVIGTPMFMSPEQAAGRELDVRTDVYSLGATLYSLIAGRPPFVGASVLDIIQRIGKAEPPRLQAFQPDLHSDVTTIVQKSMRKERVRRYQTALELAEDVQRYLSGEPIEARPMSLAERGLRYLRKRPWMVNALLFFTLAIGVGAGLVWREQNREARLRIQESVQAETKAIRTLARERLDQAKANLDAWNRFLLFAPRDLTEKNYLLTEAVSLCIAARSLGGEESAEADYHRARALFLLGRYPQAESAIEDAITLSSQDRFYLERARIRLRREVDPLEGVPLVSPDLFSDIPIAGLGIQWLFEEIRQDASEEYVSDLLMAENLGRPQAEREVFPGIDLQKDLSYKKSREFCQVFLDRTPDPGHQADFHKIMAWVGYRKLLLEKSFSEEVFLKTREHIQRALEGKRSDFDLYLLQAQVALVYGSGVRQERLTESSFPEMVSMRESVKTALVIRPEDITGRLLAAQLLAEKVEPEVWKAFRQGAEKEDAIQQIRKEYIRPGSEICSKIVADYPDAHMAWLQLVLFQWQDLLLENILWDRTRSASASFGKLVDQLAQTSLRGLQATSEKRIRALLFYFRALSSFAEIGLVKEPGKKKAARKAFFFTMEEVRLLAPDLWEQAKNLPDLLGEK